MSESHSDVMAPPGIAAFFQTWKVYQSIIQNNCMDHREVADFIAQICTEIPTPFSVLDLGCGDSQLALKALSGLPIARYTGVDLTEPALAIAKANFDGHFPAMWHHANMVTFVANSGETYDVILTSFAMHHLDSETKRNWLANIATCLAPKGSFILVDTVCPAGLSRDDSIQAYLNMIAGWPLPDDDKAAIAAHMWSSDYPESEAFLYDALTTAGFVSNVIYRHPLNLQIGYVCTRQTD